MKRSIRFPFSLLVLIAVFTVLTCHSLLRDGPGSGSRSSRAPSLNETLLRLAVLDPAEDEIRRDVNQLLAGNLPAAASRPRPVYFWRRDSRSSLQYPIRRRVPKDYRIQIQTPPEFTGSLRDWHRRRRFQPAIMSELLDLVGARRPYGSCAVVGNSGVLLNHDHGELIDGHDLVIRLNNARVDGYQRHVGSKTGISFINSNILHLCARRSGCYCHPYGASVPMVMYVCQPVHFIDYAICNASRTAPLLITDPAFDLLCAGIVKYYSLKRFGEETGKPLEEWGRSHDEKMFHYSSGLQAVMLALGFCDRVSVFGFGKSADAKHHYHTTQKAELDLHDYAAEYVLYHDLVERPQVVPFLKDSGFKIPPIVFYQ